MFTKDNIISARYMNAENDTVEVLYSEDGETHAFIFPARPTKSLPWKTLKEAGITTSKVKDNTIEWIKDQQRLQYQVSRAFAEQLKEDALAVITADMQKDYDAYVEKSAKEYDELVEKTNVEVRKRYDAAVNDMSTSVRTGKNDTNIFELLKAPTDEQIFQLKVSILEDKSTFEGLTKTAEKTKRREIRKCTTVKDLIQYL